MQIVIIPWHFWTKFSLHVFCPSSSTPVYRDLKCRIRPRRPARSCMLILTRFRLVFRSMHRRTRLHRLLFFLPLLLSLPSSLCPWPLAKNSATASTGSRYQLMALSLYSTSWILMPRRRWHISGIVAAPSAVLTCTEDSLMHMYLMNLLLATVLFSVGHF